MQCIASVICSVESSQASQMHLIDSHDKNPDLFADNDGSADETGDDAVWKHDNSGDDNLDGDDDNGDDVIEIFSWGLCTGAVHNVYILTWSQRMSVGQIYGLDNKY